MITDDSVICPGCGESLKFYDMVPRIIRTGERTISWVKIRRLRCRGCGTLHRELPSQITPYKQYDADIIYGVLDGFITCETLGYEDYPCEATMLRWLSRKAQLLLWRNP